MIPTSQQSIDVTSRGSGHNYVKIEAHGGKNNVVQNKKGMLLL